MMLDRRTFLRISSLTAVSLSAWHPRIEASTPTAGLVLRNGKIITVDSNDHIAQALAIRNGQILDVGSNESISKYIGHETKIIDLQGKTVTPGLIDSHAHLPFLGLRENGSWVNLQGLYTLEEVLEALFQKTRKTATGDWIFAWGLESMSLEFMNKTDLDKVSRKHPIVIAHTTGQWGFANTYALDVAGISKDTPNPVGGKIDKSSLTGEPTGLLIHYQALYLVRKHIPSDYDGFQRALLYACQLYAAEGVTTIHDNFVPFSEIGSGNSVNGYSQVLLGGKLPLRIKLWPYIPNINVAQQVVGDISNSKDVNPHSALKGLLFLKKEDPGLFESIWGGWKIAVDGGGPTALYYQNPFGLAMHPQKDFFELVNLLHQSDQQISIHSVGDRAVDLSLKAIEIALQRKLRRDHRHRLEHAMMPSSNALPFMKELGIVISTHPQFIYGWGDNMEGLRRRDFPGGRVIPLKSYIKNDIPVAFGADPPAFPFIQPQIALSQATIRTSRRGAKFNSSESISIKEAIRIQTMGSAYAAFQEKQIGSLEKGKEADLVVWDSDFLAITADKISKVKAELTIINGKIVYQRNKNGLS